MITLRKITDCTTERDGMIIRGIPTKITSTMITFKITKAWGSWSGTDHTNLVRGLKITAPIEDCDLYREC